MGKGIDIARKVFGFQKGRNPISQAELIAVLARMQTDINWLKRIAWLLLATVIGTSAAL